MAKSFTTKDIPVIFPSAVTEIDKVISGFEMGAIDYITKPFNVNELLARVATHIELKNAREELVEINATKDKFFSIISHDLRNPFFSILSSVELLKMHNDKNETAKTHKYACTIQNSVVLVDKLLENLIAWSQIQTGKLVQNIGKYNLKTITSEIYLLSNEIAKNKSIKLQNNITDDIYINCDLEMTKTVLRNLISNALKFTKNEGVISINSCENGQNIEVSISDNGVGISPEKIPYLFAIENNISTRGTSDEKGTGLGLLLCKEFVEKQGGVIWVESELGKGSIFKFTIPLCSD